MSTKLHDITIYHLESKQKDGSINVQFTRTSSFICDFYHRMLFGYKPLKTMRICIHLGETKNFDKPNYNGSICHIARPFDEMFFLRLSSMAKYEFLLDLVHGCCMELAEKYGWEKEHFENAYSDVKRRNFVFTITYPTKQSKNKKNKACVQVSKTEAKSSLYLIFQLADQSKQVKLLEKKNWFWVDSVYEMAENSKWLDNLTFGVQTKKNNRFGYYSLIDDMVIGNLDFKETDF